MTGHVVNLRQMRKKQRQEAKRKTANANSVAFGTPKALRDLQKAQAVKAARDHGLHKRDV